MGLELWIALALIVAAFGAAYLLPLILLALLCEQRPLPHGGRDGLSTAPCFRYPSPPSSVPLVPCPDMPFGTDTASGPQRQRRPNSMPIQIA
jgi:hypothetical protein